MVKNQIKALSYTEARQRIMQSARSCIATTETVELANAINRILAVDIFSDIDLPGADNSSMDGYCVQSSSLKGACREVPVKLPVVAGIDAGHTIDEVPPGHCAYIATGGIFPSGVDTIVRIEDTELSADGKFVSLFVESRPGQFIRPHASELKKGQLMVKAATQITPFVAGQIATAGQILVKVFKKPTVAILTSGDEVLMPWEHPKPWQVRNANSIMLCAQAQESGAQAFDAGIARDTGTHARDLFLSSLNNADMVITSGGISMGRKDPFKQVFAELGIEPVVSGVNIKPGKPLFFGLYKDKPVFGLPGNQVSSAVTFELFVRPFIRALQGISPFRLEADLQLTEESLNDSGRDFFKRGQIEMLNQQMLVKQLESQESHMLSSLAGADVLFLHPVSPQQMPAGSKVRCIFLKG